MHDLTTLYQPYKTRVSRSGEADVGLMSYKTVWIRRQKLTCRRKQYAFSETLVTNLPTSPLVLQSIQLTLSQPLSKQT
jgi:hypothetical protein